MKKLILLTFIAALFSPFMSYSQGCDDGGDEDGIKIIGYIQPQYEYQFLGDSVEKTMNGLDSKSSFYFNRVRLGVTGSIPYDFSYYFMGEYSSTKEGPSILDAFITYKRFAPYLKVSVGQFKSQFGLELSTACHSLYTINRSRVVNELASPFRDMGVMLLGSSGDKKIFGLEKEDIFKWSMAITNGTEANKYDDNLDKDFTARLVFSPFEGINLGGSYRYGRQKPIQAGMVDDSRRRYGFDISIEKTNFTLQGEYIDGYDQGSSLVGGGCGSTPTIMMGDFTKRGGWASLMYTFNGAWAPIIKYQTYNVFGEYADGTDSDQTMTEYIVGLNYYFNDWTRFQVNYVITKDTEIEDTQDFAKNYLVFQVQAKFN